MTATPSIRHIQSYENRPIPRSLWQGGDFHGKSIRVKFEFNHVPQIERQPYHEDMKNPPSKRKSQKIFDHLTSKESDQGYRPLLSPPGELSTTMALETRSAC